MFELTGLSLKRPPRGFDPNHPMIEDLKRKDFVAITSLRGPKPAMKNFSTVSSPLPAQAPDLSNFWPVPWERRLRLNFDGKLPDRIVKECPILA